jgi:hypothetical protein
MTAIWPKCPENTNITSTSEREVPPNEIVKRSWLIPVEWHVNDRLEGTWKEEAVAYFKTLRHWLLRWIWVNHESPESQQSVTRFTFETRTSRLRILSDNFSSAMFVGEWVRIWDKMVLSLFQSTIPIFEFGGGLKKIRKDLCKGSTIKIRTGYRPNKVYLQEWLERVYDFDGLRCSLCHACGKALQSISF